MMFVESLLTRYLRYVNKRTMRFELTSGANLPAPRQDYPYGLYVHVPFCEALCPFCSFHRVVFDLETAKAYFQALRLEIERYHREGYEFSSVYVGGGTPTVLPEALGETLDLIRSLFSIRQISVETNPNHLNDDVISILQAVGVNRLSVGVQSFDDALLKEMRRYERYGSGSEMTGRLRRTQGLFDTLNVDMIFDLPHQTLASLERDLDIVAQQVQANQVTFYPLMPSSATQRRMWQQVGGGGRSNSGRFYRRILEAMATDYRPGSAWCFSRQASMIDEYIVDHNEYVGVGSGAFSYRDGWVYANTFSIGEYVSRIGQGRSAVAAVRRYSEYEQMQYAFLMRLFGLSLDVAWAEARYGERFFSALWKEFLVFRLLGAIERNGDRYCLTRRGMYYWVVMMREFFVGVNNFRDQMRSLVER